MSDHEVSPEPKPLVVIPFNLLPEGQSWRIGQSYRVRVVLKQLGKHEDHAEFELVDATSLESPDKGSRHLSTNEGILLG